MTTRFFWIGGPIMALLLVCAGCSEKPGDEEAAPPAASREFRVIEHDAHALFEWPVNRSATHGALEVTLTRLAILPRSAEHLANELVLGEEPRQDAYYFVCESILRLDGKRVGESGTVEVSLMPWEVRADGVELNRLGDQGYFSLVPPGPRTRGTFYFYARVEPPAKAEAGVLFTLKNRFKSIGGQTYDITFEGLRLPSE